MVATINIQPNLTTNAAGSFPNPSTVGVIQGMAYDDPAVRYQLAGGILATSETLPMWGGVGISENIPTVGTQVSPQPSTALGGQIIRATNLTAHTAGQLTGFSVFNQNYSAIVTPTSEVALVGSGGMVNFFRLGTNARIPVACDPILADLYGDPITAQTSWDFVNQILVPYVGTLTISSGTYNNTTGVTTLTMSAPITFGPGDAIVVSGLTGSNITTQNGTFTALAGTTGSTVVYNPGAALGATTITGGSLTLGSGASSLLPVKVLEIITFNCMTVNYNAATGNATWNRNGSCAIVLI